MRIINLFIILLGSFLTTAQVGINTAVPNHAAALDVSNKTVNFGGLKIPIINESQINQVATTAASEGTILFVNYPTGNRCLEIYDGLQDVWQKINCLRIVLPASDLFISEYVEGSGNNKAIEIANFTGAAVDLSDYRVNVYANGNTSPTASSSFNLSGNLPDGAVYVVVHLGSDTALTSLGDLVINFTYNGDDAIELVNQNIGNAIDIIGVIGEDPGASWNQLTNSTENQTLRRNSGISGSISTITGFPTLGTEWTSFPLNDFSNLGTHSF